MMLSFSSNVLFINKLHYKSFLSNFWGAVQEEAALSMFVEKELLFYDFHFFNEPRAFAEFVYDK